MEGHTNAPQQPQQPVYAGVAPAYPVQPSYPQQHYAQQPPMQAYFPAAPIAPRKPFPSSALSICLILTVIGCIIGCVVALTSTDATLYDGMPDSCCAKAGGSAGWTDLYCSQCNDRDGCSYQSVCDAHPEWTSCCWNNACLTPSYKDLFIVCNTGNTLQGFDWTASSLGTPNFAHWPLFAMCLGGGVSALICWFVLLKSRSNPDFLMRNQPVVMQQQQVYYHAMP